MAKPIVENLRSVYTDDGEDRLIDRAAETLADVVKAVGETGKAGKVTITIDVRKATAGALAVKGSVTAKVPKGQAVEALLWPTPEGNLLTEDPAQAKLDLRPVKSAAPAEVKVVPAA